MHYNHCLSVRFISDKNGLIYYSNEKLNKTYEWHNEVMLSVRRFGFLYRVSQ